MEFARKTVKGINIIYVIIAVIVCTAAAYCMGFGDFFEKICAGFLGRSAEVDSNSPSAGYEVLAYVFIGGGGLIMGILLFALGLFLSFIGIVLIINSVVGIIRLKKYHETGNVSLLKRELIGKLIINSLAMAYWVIGIFSDFTVFGLGCALLCIIIEIFAANAFSKVK